MYQSIRFDTPFVIIQLFTVKIKQNGNYIQPRAKIPHDLIQINSWMKAAVNFFA